MIGDSIGKGVQAKKQLEAAKKAQQQARQDRERALWINQQQDWQPEMVSDHIGPYQRSTSPVADAFLQSLLTGDNSAAVQGTRADSGQRKAQAQRGFNRNYGGWDQVRQKQREMESSTPWEVKPFTREVSTPDVSAESWTAYKAGGLAPEEVRQLERDGFKFNDQGEFRNKGSAKSAQKAMIGATGRVAGSADSPEGRAFMRGLARARSQGMSLDQALALGRDELMRRGA